jgi:mRNA interferase RelE/StbE
MSRYRIELVPAAARQLGSLPKKQQVRITSKIDGLSSDPRPPGCVKLGGSEDIYRIRVGDYRILYQVKDDILLVLVVKVAKRGEAYKIEK